MVKRNTSQIALSVNNLHKSFRLPYENQNSIKGKLINFRRRGYETQKVLKGVSFEVNKGDFFGIVGRNGSGKSTLLKLLAGIYTPNKGSVEVNGKLTPFIELGVGFNPELSGRDNVFLNGALLGFTRSEMEEKYDDIVAFAELERFMDQKLKNYSSGMQVRLAFSIAIRADADILVLDEVLAVGDEAFQQKCFQYFNDLKRLKKTVILVTHDMASVQRFCNRAMMIEDGKIVMIGSPAHVAGKYTLSNIAENSHASAKNKSPKSKNIIIDNIIVKNGDRKTKVFSKGDDITVEVYYTVRQLETFSIGMSIRTQDDNLLAGIGSQGDIQLSKFEPGSYKSICTIPARFLMKGQYSLNFSFWSESRELLTYLDTTLGGGDVPIINVKDITMARSGLFNIDGTWKNPERLD